MAVKATSSYNTRSNSYSKPSTSPKSNAPSKASTAAKPSTSAPSKAASAAPKRDTFTYSSPAAKASAVVTKTTASSNTKAAAVVKPITTTVNNIVKTITTAKPGTTTAKPTASNTAKTAVTAKPGTTTAKPTASNTVKAAATAKPGTTTAKTNTSSTVKASATAKPGTTSAKTNTSSTVKASATAKSSATNNKTNNSAAASVGTKLDKNGKPAASNAAQGQSNGSILKNIKSNAITFVTNIETKSSGAKTPGDKTNEVSSKYTQKEIEQMEKDEGTIYVWRYVYNKDLSEYNYLQRTEEICGFKINDIHDKEKVNQLNNILYGVQNQNEIWHQTNGINYSNGNMNKIPCQSTKHGGEFDGWSGCVSTSIAAMFRINDNAVGSASELVKCNDNGTYPQYGRDGYSFNKYGKTTNGLGINQDKALKLIKTSLSNGDVCCVKLDKGTTDGHTVVCSGVRKGISLKDATWGDLLFNDVGRGDEENRIARTMAQMSYMSSSGKVEYSAPKDGNCCVIIDATR